MKQTSRTPREGFTLMEMMAVMGTMAAAMLLGGAILIGALRTEESATTAHRRLVQRNTLADQIRADVAQASAAPDRFAFGEAKETAGPTCLILTRPDKREVVYLWNAKDKELWRWETPDGQALEKPLQDGNLKKRSLSAGSDCKGVEFIRGQGDPPLITMRLLLAAPKGNPDHPIEFSAVLGGDLR
jgi:type II secretory pathway pseudopilin PulG